MARKAQKKTNAPAQARSMGGMSLMFTGLPTDVEIQITQRAYELYSARGGEAGHDLEDWLRAEKEIMHAVVRSGAVAM
jgi:Protein of unknown function (DUF2934)